MKLSIKQGMNHTHTHTPIHADTTASAHSDSASTRGCSACAVSILSSWWVCAVGGWVGVWWSGCLVRVGAPTCIG